MIRGACTSLGSQSHYQDWMIDVPIQGYSDSSAARSVARRTWNRTTSEALADTTLSAAEPSSSWSLEVGCRCRRPESSRHTHETVARSQDSRAVRHVGLHCSTCKVEYIVMDASRDQLDRVDRARLVESGGARDDSVS